MTTSTYSADEITARLASELPQWQYADGFIQRRYATSGWKSTLMVINTVGHLAEAAWHHPDIEASYPFVRVKLQTHDANGITDKDFELAKMIEQVILWRPGADSALDGTPKSKQFAYIHYDTPNDQETSP